MRGSTFISTALKGAAMGVAEVIPGVSGGTIAFITGIYERLLASISSIGPGLWKTWKTGGLRAVWEQLDGNFLLALLVGMLLGLIAGVFGVSYILEHYPPVIWSFFFALIIASSIYMIRQVKTWSIPNVMLLVLGVGIAYGITVLVPSNGSEALWFVYLSGCLAITALILPGISGSFILLLLGMYTFVIPTVKSFLKTGSMDALTIVLVFGLGCITGVVLFSRVLTYVFKNYKNATIALLTGFMIGSLNKIWPWRICGEELVLADKVKCIRELNVLPTAYTGDSMLLGALLAFAVGIVLVWFLAKSDRS
jgi:putative membrane protein